MPCAVVLKRREVRGAFWSETVYDLNNVLVGEHLSLDQQAASGITVTESVSDDLQVWSGLSVTLYKDACERYWHALIGDRPKVYVVCRTDETDGTSEPWIVTIDYDEALSYSETDSTVLSCPIPGELYRQMERWVLQHYKPQKFHKRKRKKWATDEASRRPHHLAKAGQQHAKADSPDFGQSDSRTADPRTANLGKSDNGDTDTTNPEHPRRHHQRGTIH